MVFKLDRLRIASSMIDGDGRPLQTFKKPYDKAMGAIEDQFYVQDAFNTDLTVITDDLADANDLILQNIIDISTVQVDMLDTQGELQDAVDLLGVQQGQLSALQSWQSGAILTLADQQGDINDLLFGLAMNDLILAGAVDDLGVVVENLGEDIMTLTGAWGSATASPDANGYDTISYSFDWNLYAGEVPPLYEYRPRFDVSAAWPVGATFFHVQMTAVTSSTFTVRLFDATGAPITSGSYTIRYAIRPQLVFIA